MGTPRKRRGCAWRLLKAAAAFAIVLSAAAVAIAFADWNAALPEFAFDASPHLGADAARLFDSKTISARLRIGRGASGGLVVSATGMLFDWPFSSSANVGFGFMRAHGDFSFGIVGTDLRILGDFDVRSTREWKLSAHMPKASFAHDDRILGHVLSRLGASSVSNIACRASASLDAVAGSSAARPVPEWSVNGSVAVADASFVTDETPVAVSNMRLKFAAGGIGDRCEVKPMFPRADSVEVSGVALSNAFANVIVTDRAYLVTEAGAACAGGKLKLYALFLDPKRLTAGATVYVEDVDAGEALSYVPGFRGAATGRLHGKIKFFLKNGQTLGFRDAYLFSIPGETGRITIDDGKPLIDNLAIGGVPEDVCKNLSMALANLYYSALRLKLDKNPASSDSVLSLRLKGNATHESTTVPVDLDIRFRGDIDQLVNTGMKITRRKSQ